MSTEPREDDPPVENKGAELARGEARVALAQEYFEPTEAEAEAILRVSEETDPLVETPEVAETEDSESSPDILGSAVSDLVASQLADIDSRLTQICASGVGEIDASRSGSVYLSGEHMGWRVDTVLTVRIRRG